MRTFRSYCVHHEICIELSTDLQKTEAGAETVGRELASAVEVQEKKGAEAAPAWDPAVGDSLDRAVWKPFKEQDNRLMSPGDLLSFFHPIGSQIQWILLSELRTLGFHRSSRGMFKLELVVSVENSHWRALIYFFKSNWKRSSLVPQRYEIPGFISVWLWQMYDRSVPMTDRCVGSPFILVHFIILEPKSGVCNAVPGFFFPLLKRNTGHIFFLGGSAFLFLDCF